MFSGSGNTFHIIRNGASGGTSTLPSNRWVHVLAVIGQGIGRVYFDGVLDLSSGGAGGATTNNTAGSDVALMTISTSNVGGLVHDPRIYNRVLTAAQAWNLHDPATRWELYEIPRHNWAVRWVGAPPGVTVPVLEYHYRHH